MDNKELELLQAIRGIVRDEMKQIIDPLESDMKEVKERLANMQEDIKNIKESAAILKSIKRGMIESIKQNKENK